MGRKASFGYTEVEYTEKEKLVRGVFERVAPSYDVMNDLMSAGVHRLWKDYFVSKVGAFAGMTHLDVAGGTGDIAFRVLRALQKAEKNAELDGQVLDGKTRGRVIVSDINPAMLREGIKRATQRGLSQSQLEWLEGNAEKLPIEDNSIDVYTIAFGLRNVTNTSAALADAHRCLKPGGKYMILEFSHVESEPLKSVYDFYSFNVIPKLGEIVARDRDSYQYLVESIRKFPTQEKLKTMMRDVGFKHVTHENLTGGMVAIHTGYKE
jgi:2-methoxy-6-polyprenyl-1,4-benzoquinol methylase